MTAIKRLVLDKLAVVRARAGAVPMKPRWSPYPWGPRGDVVFAELMVDPDYARLYRDYVRPEIEADYALLFATLAVAPEKLEKLEELLLERQASELDVDDLATRTGLESRREVREKIAGEIDGEIRALLGPEAFAQFKRFDESVAQRGVIADLAKRLSYEDVALDAQQAARLVDIFSETWSDEERTRDGRIIVSDEFVARAREVVSATQWERLKAFQAEQKAMKPKG